MSEDAKATAEALGAPASSSDRGEDSTRGASRLLLVSNDAMRARRRPRAILWMWLFQATLALTVAWPAANAVHASYGQHPQGDAALFADGGYALLEWLVREDTTLAALGVTYALASVLSLLLGVFPFIALVASLAYTTADLRAPRLAQLAPYVSRGAWPTLGLVALGTLGSGLVLLLGAIAAGATSSALTARFGDARGGQAAVVVFLLFALGAMAVGVVFDLAKVAVVRTRKGALASLATGFRSFRKNAPVLFWSWAWRALVTAVLVGGGALLATRLGGRPGVALFALAALHQLVVVARVAVRASWLARALRAIDVDAG